MKAPYIDGLRIYPEMPGLRPPDLRKVWAGECADWTLMEPWLGPLIGGSATLALQGGRTDGGSVPRPAWSLMGHPFLTPHLAYYLAHDFDYKSELRRRAVCDARLFKGMAMDGAITYAEREGVYLAVREFGGSVWAQHDGEAVLRAREFVRIVYEEEYFALCEARGFSWRGKGKA